MSRAVGLRAPSQLHPFINLVPVQTQYGGSPQPTVSSLCPGYIWILQLLTGSVVQTLSNEVLWCYLSARWVTQIGRLWKMDFKVRAAVWWWCAWTFIWPAKGTQRRFVFDFFPVVLITSYLHLSECVTSSAWQQLHWVVKQFINSWEAELQTYKSATINIYSLNYEKKMCVLHNL